VAPRPVDDAGRHHGTEPGNYRIRQEITGEREVITAGRVLIAEDEPVTAAMVVSALEGEGFEVTSVADGRAALASALGGGFDLVTLDWMLPGMTGLDVCRALRQRSDVPILMLTSRTEESDVVRALELGADDYVTKPFSLAILVTRVRAILRRRAIDREARPNGGEVRTVGAVTLDLARHEVVVDGRAVELTRAEFNLLALLSSRPGETFTRDQITQHLWRSETVPPTRSCDFHVRNLRRKIERDAARPERLLTVRGAGYRLAA
jgi:DNA-binding response OmpR family regulator